MIDIPLARPSITDAELAAADRALRSGRLSLGPENERFEAGLAAACGRAHAVAVSSGTVALELSLWALELPGADALVTAFGFPAAAHAVVRGGGRPFPADVDPATWNLSEAAALAGLEAAAAAGGAPRALISIDQLGLPAEAGPLARVARARDLVLIDDAACALGGLDAAGVRGGGYGACATLSFHARKAITTGEGGAVLTDDPDLAAAVRRLRNLGQAGRGVFAHAGTNARLSEVAAAVGHAQLARLDAMLAERRLLAEGYRERLARLLSAGRISWQEVSAPAMHAYQTFAVLLAAGIDREAVCARLAARGVEAAPATYAFHRADCYRDRPELRAVRLPVADALHDRALALPLYPGMRSAQLDRVCAALAEALGEGGP